jgi:hypothetical protein
VEVIDGCESFLVLFAILHNALSPLVVLPTTKCLADSFSACYRDLHAHLGIIAKRNSRGLVHENSATEGPHRH